MLVFHKELSNLSSLNLTFNSKPKIVFKWRKQYFIEVLEVYELVLLQHS